MSAGVDNTPMSNSIGRTPSGKTVRCQRNYAVIDDVGQTSTPTVGRNFMKALEKGHDQAFDSPTHLVAGLQRLGFNALAAELAPLATAASLDNAVEEKVALWRLCAGIYTREDSGEEAGPAGEEAPRALHRELNDAILRDAESLHDWAPFIALLIRAGGSPNTVDSRNVQVPPENRAGAQMTYRAFAVNPSMMKSYAKGETFFWKTFVSTAKDFDIAWQFALNCAREGLTPLLFEIDIPQYEAIRPNRFYAYELDSTVCASPGEEEVLLLPYTRFVVEDTCQDELGVTRVRIKALNIPFHLEWTPEVSTIFVDPNGFDSGINRELVKEAFMSGMPSFRTSQYGEVKRASWGEYRSMKKLFTGQQALALFRKPRPALDWIEGELKKVPGVAFRIILAGSASVEFIDGYFAAPTPNPCELLVFCSDVAKWSDHWRHFPRVQVTDDPASVRSFFEHKVYHPQSDSFGPARLPADGTNIWYPWRKLDHGVVYGASGAEGQCIEAMWSQGGGTVPTIPMLPFEEADPTAKTSVEAPASQGDESLWRSANTSATPTTCFSSCGTCALL